MLTSQRTTFKTKSPDSESLRFTIIHSFLRWQLWKAECALSLGMWSPPCERTQGAKHYCVISPQKCLEQTPCTCKSLVMPPTEGGPCFGTPACSRYSAHRPHKNLSETWKQLGALGTVPRKHDAFPRGISRQQGREEGSIQDKAWLHITSWATPHKTSRPSCLPSTALVFIVCKVSFKLWAIISSSS